MSSAVSSANPNGTGQIKVIALVAGEASGDQLGGALIAELKTHYPQVRFVGVGGERMQSQGLELWAHCDELAVMGLTEVISHLPRLLRLRHRLKLQLLELKPDVFIGIDAPDFNLGLEKQLRDKGITTVHYVSPTVWAWRQGRVKKIRAAVERVLCLFPFEPAFYKEHAVDAVYTGHPLADEIEPATRSDSALNPTGSQATFIALLPGSRRGEVERLAPYLCSAAQLIQQKIPDVRFVVPVARPGLKQLFADAAAKYPEVPIELIEKQARKAITDSQLVICASGTVTLEAMLINRPMIVVYRFSAITYFIGRTLKLMKSRFFSLPNILAGEALVPELEQHQVTGENICHEAMNWLDNPERIASVQQKFDLLHAQLRVNAAKTAANSVAQLLDKPR